MDVLCFPGSALHCTALPNSTRETSMQQCWTHSSSKVHLCQKCYWSLISYIFSCSVPHGTRSIPEIEIMEVLSMEELQTGGARQKDSRRAAAKPQQQAWLDRRGTGNPAWSGSFN